MIPSLLPPAAIASSFERALIDAVAERIQALNEASLAPPLPHLASKVDAPSLHEARTVVWCKHPAQECRSISEELARRKARNVELEMELAEVKQTLKDYYEDWKQMVQL